MYLRFFLVGYESHSHNCQKGEPKNYVEEAPSLTSEQLNLKYNVLHL